ncbi:hypothetical protein Dsin_007058 [Dipteronia sinensis]|uniref:Uncharacterized protein n=1 Tax=Dipteronia sinensis TaxID=43782 RepID=A0AAE0EG72_9ROSI|nr:hypothetical protein Dsin_007058 [Dipteronia sinensis]
MTTRIFKGNYFRKTDFLQVGCKDADSFLCKSFIWGKELLEAGSWWRVGNGPSIKIYKNLWILRLSTFGVISSPVLKEIAKVSQLKTQQGGWNVDLINETFLEEDVATILSMPTAVNSINYGMVYNLFARIPKFEFEWSFAQQPFSCVGGLENPRHICFYKINTDAAVDRVREVIEIGIVIRDEAGLVMASSSQRITTTFTPQVAEAVAVL